MFSYTEDSFLPFPPNQLLSPEQVFLFFSSFWNILHIFIYLCLNIWLMVGFHCSIRFFNHSTLYLIVHSVLVHTTFNSCVVFHNWRNESLVIDTWGCFFFYFFCHYKQYRNEYNCSYIFEHVYKMIAKSLISGQKLCGLII